MKWMIFLAILTNVCLTPTLSHDKANKDINWNIFMQNALWSTKGLMWTLKPLVMENFPFGNVSAKCTESLIMYANGVKDWEPWAVKMFDATGKFPSGFLSGTVTDFGSFDDCLAIRKKSTDAPTSSSFKGKFCMLSLQSPIFKGLSRNSSMRTSYIELYGYPPPWIAVTMEEFESLLNDFGLFLGICVPSTCSEQDIVNVVSAFSRFADIEPTLSDCQVDEPRKWPLSAVLALSLISGVLCICLIGTVFDMVDRKKTDAKEQIKTESCNRKIFKSFSFYTNGEKLFKTQEKKSAIDCIPGIRFWICNWIILTHIYIYPNLWKEKRYTHYFHMIKMSTGTAILAENGGLNVENFFFISGFLMTYTLWDKLASFGGRINFIHILINKYWRLTPAYTFTIILSFAMPVLYSAPTWNSVWEREVARCQSNGWKNLLYIHNLDETDNMCWLHTWFLSALVQIQIVSTFLMVLTYKYPKIGIFSALLLISACLVRDFKISLSNEFLFPTPNSMRDFDHIKKYITEIHSKPYTHFATHVIGMLLGWIVLKHRDKKLSQAYHVVAWILCLVIHATLLFIVWMPTKNIVFAAFHNAARRTIWSLGFAWLMYACTTGSGGLLEKSFSLRVLVPFGEVSYCAYLVHPLLYVFRDAALKQRTYMAKFPHFVDFLALSVASFSLGFVIYLMVEAPFNRLYVLWLKKNLSSISKAQESIKLAKEEKYLENENYKKGL